jgi:thioesterase domain-containing protein
LPVYLGPDQPLYGVEHHANDGNPALYREVGTIAKHYIDEIREVHPRGPYLLGGFSFGAVVAYEMAGRLKKEGHEVDLLFMLDPTGKASDKTEKEKPLPLISRAYRTLNRLQWTTCAAMGRLLPPPLRSPYILDIYRKALRSYVPKPYTGRVVIFKTGGPYATPFNWLELIQGDLELHESTGDHMDLRKEPLIGRWAQRLKESLDRASESNS